jgi:hypothetical protein
MRMSKKVLCIVLCLAMVLGLCAVTAGAEGAAVATEAALTAAVETGGTVTLGGDIRANIVIPADKTVTLNLNGHNITNTTKQVPTITNNGTLTVTGAGTIDNQARTDSSHYNLPAVLNNGTAFLNGGTFTRSLDDGTSANDHE